MKPHSSHWLDTRQGSLSQSWGPYVKLPNEFRAGGIHLRTQNNRFTLMIGFVGKWSLWRDCETSGKRINKTRVTVGVSLQAQTPGPWKPYCQRCIFDFYQSASVTAKFRRLNHWLAWPSGRRRSPVKAIVSDNPQAEGHQYCSVCGQRGW